MSSILSAEEYTDQPQFLLKNEAENNGFAVQVKNATFNWVVAKDEEDGFELKDFNLDIPAGALVAVIGQVGAGKSSLLSALIGDMKKKSGEVIFRGKVGYCQQQAWILNTTLRENVVFGSEYDPVRYQKVLKVCELEGDISILPGGDLTEIGENGINISGGQKQRLSLARAVYNNPDIILLDDPLSAVDSHVGKALFDNCITKALKNKTRIFVTHQLHFISTADLIIMMDNGSIVCKGTYKELMETSEEFKELLSSFKGSEEDETDDITATSVFELKKAVSKIEITDQVKPVTTGEVLTSKEEQAKGAVDAKVLRLYFGYAGGLFAASLVILWMTIANGVRVGTDQWLVIWISNTFNLEKNAYIIIFIVVAVSQLIFNLAYGLSMAFYGAKASRRVHNLAIAAVFKCPVSFFDQNPLGRITSRFSRDIDTLDTLLPESLRAFFWTLSTCFFNLALISYFLPIFMIPVALMFVFYYYIKRFS